MILYYYYYINYYYYYTYTYTNTYYYYSKGGERLPLSPLYSGITLGDTFTVK